MPKQSYTSLLQQYQTFCANPLRGVAQVAKEYEELTHHPRVKNIGFYAPDILMIGTDSIVVRSMGVDYEIGEMIIFFVRRQVNGYYNVDFRFINITHPIVVQVDADELPAVTNMHPHISASVITSPVYGLTPLTGKLCISHGQFDVQAAIRRGEMHVAVPRMIEILECYDEDNAYISVRFWPEL
jgi:hypothetical protein